MPQTAAMFVARRSLLTALPAGPRHCPAVSLRVRASCARRRLAVEPTPARTGGANRRTSDDVRHAA
jgi:hypothetical protein